MNYKVLKKLKKFFQRTPLFFTYKLVNVSQSTKIVRIQCLDFPEKFYEYDVSDNLVTEFHQELFNNLYPTFKKDNETYVLDKMDFKANRIVLKKSNDIFGDSYVYKLIVPLYKFKKDILNLTAQQRYEYLMKVVK